MKLGAVVSLLLVTGALAHFIADYVHYQWGLAVSFISIGTGFVSLLNMFLWHLPLIRYMYEFPDMRGTFEGVLTYSFRDANNVEQTGEMPTKREISQNGYSVFIRTTVLKADFTTSSISTACEANVIVEDDNTVKLEFTYNNEGDPLQGFPTHQGTEILRFNKKEGTLIGHYYTNRLPFQTKGIINLRQSLNTK